MAGKLGDERSMNGRMGKGPVQALISVSCPAPFSNPEPQRSGFNSSRVNVKHVNKIGISL